MCVWKIIIRSWCQNKFFVFSLAFVTFRRFIKTAIKAWIKVLIEIYGFLIKMACALVLFAITCRLFIRHGLKASLLPSLCVLFWKVTNNRNFRSTFNNFRERFLFRLSRVQMDGNLVTLFTAHQGEIDQSSVVARSSPQNRRAEEEIVSFLFLE